MLIGEIVLGRKMLVILSHVDETFKTTLKTTLKSNSSATSLLHFIDTFRPGRSDCTSNWISINREAVDFKNYLISST
jgi:hypothetical protein